MFEKVILLLQDLDLFKKPLDVLFGLGDLLKNRPVLDLLEPQGLPSLLPENLHFLLLREISQLQLLGLLELSQLGQSDDPSPTAPEVLVEELLQPNIFDL